MEDEQTSDEVTFLPETLEPIVFEIIESVLKDKVLFTDLSICYSVICFITNFIIITIDIFINITNTSITTITNFKHLLLRYMMMLKYNYG
jgi:hypothetical protein